MMTVHEMLQQEIESLSASLAEEVFDFVLFVKARHAEEAFLWQQVEKTYSYRRQYPETVKIVTADEWDKLTAHLEDEADDLPSAL